MSTALTDLPMLRQPDRAPCPCKRDERHDCQGRRPHPTAICNGIMPEEWFVRNCERYPRLAVMKERFPQFWEPDGCCCQEYRNLFVDCAEESGFMAGAFDIRRYPNDGKDVWRNYSRVRFRFCPFCGAPLEPAADAEAGRTVDCENEAATYRDA